MHENYYEHDRSKAVPEHRMSAHLIFCRNIQFFARFSNFLESRGRVYKSLQGSKNTKARFLKRKFILPVNHHSQLLMDGPRGFQAS